MIKFAAALTAIATIFALAAPAQAVPVPNLPSNRAVEYFDFIEGDSSSTKYDRYVGEQILWDNYKDQLFVSRLVELRSIDGTDLQTAYLQANCTKRRYRVLFGVRTRNNRTHATWTSPGSWMDIPEGVTSPMADACENIQASGVASR